jgi:DNA repair protein RadC
VPKTNKAKLLRECRASNSVPTQRVHKISSEKPASTIPKGRFISVKEWELVTVREQLLPQEMILCDRAAAAVQYWKTVIQPRPQFAGECEYLFVLLLNSRKRIMGHTLVSTGTVDSIVLNTSSVFGLAAVANASAIILMHNHPSGEALPSEADIQATQEMVNAGRILNIQVLDHVIVGNGQYSSVFDGMS